MRKAVNRIFIEQGKIKALLLKNTDELIIIIWKVNIIDNVQSIAFKQSCKVEQKWKMHDFQFINSIWP